MRHTYAKIKIRKIFIVKEKLRFLDSFPRDIVKSEAGFNFFSSCMCVCVHLLLFSCVDTEHIYVHAYAICTSPCFHMWALGMVCPYVYILLKTGSFPEPAAH